MNAAVPSDAFYLLFLWIACRSVDGAAKSSPGGTIFVHTNILYVIHLLFRWMFNSRNPDRFPDGEIICLPGAK